MPSHYFHPPLPSFWLLSAIFILNGFFCGCSADGNAQQISALLLKDNGTTMKPLAQQTTKSSKMEGDQPLAANSALGLLIFMSTFAAPPSADASIGNGTFNVSASVGNGILPLGIGNAIASASNKNNGAKPPMDLSLIKLRKAGTLDPLTGLELYLLVMLVVGLCSIMLMLALLCCCCCGRRHKSKRMTLQGQTDERWQPQNSNAWRRAIMPAARIQFPRVPMPSQNWPMNIVPTTTSSTVPAGRRAALKFLSNQPLKIAEI